MAKTSAAVTIVNNTLRAIPGTRNWDSCEGVARLIVDDLVRAGATIEFPEGAPDVKAVTKTDAAFARLVDAEPKPIHITNIGPQPRSFEEGYAAGLADGGRPHRR